MYRLCSVGRRRAPSVLTYGSLLLALLALAGCMSEETRRGQSEEESDHDRYGVRIIGDVTSVGNLESREIAGIGLVVGLDETGAEATHDQYRTMLEDQLRKRSVKNIKEELNDKNHALVLITAHIPPGTVKGDRIDVDVALPPESKATSLRGGYLRECWLYEYESSHRLRPDTSKPDGLIQGRMVGIAEGPVLVGFGEGDAEIRVKQGKIWAGARSLDESPLMLLLNEANQSGRIAEQVAIRINTTFLKGPRGNPASEIAHASNKLGLDVRAPLQYKNNLQRFLRVVRMIPLNETLDAPGSATDRRSYRQRLAEDLLDPTRTVVAALRLEALGERSKEILKVGLEHKHPLVRFCSAEALAYLGSPSCGEELALAARSQPLFRAFALAALASLDEAVSRAKLVELMAMPIDDETRYGSFKALYTLDPRNADIQGEFLNDSFWVHVVAPRSPSLVHISSTKRAEVVLFGEEPMLKKPFNLIAGPFVLRSTIDDDQCVISKVSKHRRDPEYRKCGLGVNEVLHAMADLGASYPEVIELLHESSNIGCLSCRVRCDALPQGASVYDLQKAGNGAIELNGVNGSYSAEADLGATPTLYELGPANPTGAR